MANIEPDFSDELPDASFLALALTGENIADYLDESQIGNLAQEVKDGFDSDEETMQEWREGAEKGVDLAKMAQGEKTYPWDNAADAKYPLITQAALQFNARVYPALVPDGSPVKVKVWGQDQDGAKAARGQRVSEFMNLQLSVSDWESDIDELTMRLPIVGCIPRKVFYSPVRGLQATTCGKVVLDNNCTSLESMPRISEEIELFPYEIEERIRAGRYSSFEYEKESNESHCFIEQHCRVDLDEDGYQEPYIVTIHKALGKVVRVVANFEREGISRGDDGSITAVKDRDYYVFYHFVPSMDGTFMGIGFGHLLSNSSELINGIINQMLDSAHLASLGGGFLGLGMNLKGGPIRLRPGEYKPVPASGADIRGSIVPMTFPGPSTVMFQLLGLLIDAGRDVAAISDVMTGDGPSAQQPAATTLALIEQGMATFTAAYKRIYRSMGREFAMMCRINAETVDPRMYGQMLDGDRPADPRRDFSLDDMDIQPVADPKQVTNMQRMAKAQLLQDMSATGAIDQTEATRRVLEAAGIAEIDQLMPQPDPRMQAQGMMMAALQTKLAEAELAQKYADVAKTESETAENLSEAVESRAQAVEDVAKTQAETQGLDLDRILRVLETLAQFREGSGNETGRPGRMAQRPQDGGSAAGAQGGGGQPPASNVRNVLALRRGAGRLPGSEGA